MAQKEGERMKTYGILYYYGEYHVCVTKVYKVEILANNEDEARQWLKQEHPTATIKQLIEFS